MSVAGDGGFSSVTKHRTIMQFSTVVVTSGASGDALLPVLVSDTLIGSVVDTPVYLEIPTHAASSPNPGLQSKV